MRIGCFGHLARSSSLCVPTGNVDFVYLGDSVFHPPLFATEISVPCPVFPRTIERNITPCSPPLGILRLRNNFSPLLKSEILLVVTSHAGLCRVLFASATERAQKSRVVVDLYLDFDPFHSIVLRTFRDGNPLLSSGLGFGYSLLGGESDCV